MRLSLIAMAVGLLAVSTAIAAPSSVSLVLTDNDATPNSKSVLPGQTFNVTLNLVTTTATSPNVQDRTTGINYYLSMFGAGSGNFRIVDRNIGASTYSDLYNVDGDVEGELLDPINDDDLGGTLPNSLTTSNGAGTFLVANYTIGVEPGTPFGSYVLVTDSLAGTGWAGPNPEFTDHEFTSHASFNIVVPEPASIAMLGLAFVGVVRRCTSR